MGPVTLAKMLTTFPRQATTTYGKQPPQLATFRVVKFYDNNTDMPQSAC